MRITIYGTRGSYPVSTTKIVRYGGNTTCFLIEENEDQVIIDGGSGIVNLGNDITDRKSSYNKLLNILCTHTHWDHIMGYPFFKPFYSSKFTINVYGANSETMKLTEVFTRQHHTLNYPVPFENLKAKINFTELSSNDTIELKNTKIYTYQLNHPGKDLGYRFVTDNGTFVVLTDLAIIDDNYLGMGMEEASKDNPKRFEQEYYDGLVNFIKGADLVLHDTNFTEEEIQNRRHWGHSCPEDALRLLSELDSPPALILSHHDPFHSDNDMDEIYNKVKVLNKGLGIEILIAKEGGRFYL